MACTLCLIHASPAAGTPLFGAPIPYGPFPTDATVAVAVGDFNGDGRLDLVVPQFLTPGLSVFLGKGDGTFGPPLDSGGPNLYGSAVVADLNGDGREDVAAAEDDGTFVSRVLVFGGRGDGTFDPPTGLPMPYVNSVAVGDVNRDSRPDLVAAGYGGVSVLLGNGDGTFAPRVDYPFYSPWGIAIGDLNRDGRPDVAVSLLGNNSRVGFAVLIGNGDGTLAPPQFYPGPGSGAYAIAIADLDRDANPDVVLQNYSSYINGPAITTHFGDGSGAFSTYIGYPASGGQPEPEGTQSLAVGDLNNDGLPDIALGTHPGTGIQVYLGVRDEFFGDVYFVRDQVYGDLPSYGVAIGDLDGDGRADLVALGEVLLNVGPPAAKHVEALPPRLEIRHVGPIGPSLSLRYRLPTLSSATIEVFDVQGRLVERRSAPSTGPDWQSISISGLPSGVYLTRIDQAGMRATARAIVVR